MFASCCVVYAFPPFLPLTPPRKSIWKCINLPTVDRPTDRGLVKLTIILSDLDDFSEMNSAYSDFLASRGVGPPPSRTTFQAGGKMPKNAK